MLAAIGLLLLAAPVVNNFTAFNVFFNCFMTFFFLSSIYAVSLSVRQSMVATVSAIPMLAYTWKAYLPSIPYLEHAGCLSGFFFSILIIASIGKFIVRSRRVTLDMIFGSLIIYCFMGIGWGFFYTFLHHFAPGSFNNIVAGTVEENLSSFFYFSFVTLSTLGYGDITPALQLSRNLVVFEALLGQIYLVVMVAWLVGMKVSQDMESSYGRNGVKDDA
jgi:hypothetical protein